MRQKSYCRAVFCVRVIISSHTWKHPNAIRMGIATSSCRGKRREVYDHTRMTFHSSRKSWISDTIAEKQWTPPLT
jgi:hypothetical protein